MKGSPIHPEYHSEGDSGNEFDPQADFAEFLKEAKKFANEKKVAQGGRTRGGKGSRKPWEASLFSFWRTKKNNNKALMEETPSPSNPQLPNPSQHGQMSSSLNSSRGGHTSRLRLPMSGPITSLLGFKKRAEKEVPYLNLDKLNCPKVVKAYGPVYTIS